MVPPCTYLIVPVEVLFEPIKHIVAREVGKNALVKVRATATPQVINVMNVHWNFPDAWERFCRTGFNFARMRYPIVQGVGPDGCIRNGCTDRAIPHQTFFNHCIKLILN